MTGNNVNGMHTVTWTDEAAVTITNASDMQWHVQLFHENLSVTMDQQYTVCFDGRASINRMIGIDVDNPGDGFASLINFGTTIGLTTTAQNLSYTFTPNATVAAARLIFQLADDGSGAATLNGETVFLDNVGVYEGDACPDAG